LIFHSIYLYLSLVIFINMLRIFNQRVIIFQIIIIVLTSSILIPSISSTKTNPDLLKTNHNTIKSKEKINLVLSSENANLLLNQFYQIEQEYIGVEKIKKQIEILKEYNVFLDNNVAYHFLKTIERIDALHHHKSKNNGIFIGPTIISHFIPRGSITGTSFNRSWYYENYTKNLTGFLNGTIFDGVIGALPIYIGISLKPVFITAVGIGHSGVYSKVFFPFFELILPCIGFSIRIKNDSGEIFFEYNLDFCLFGVLKGFNLEF